MRAARAGLFLLLSGIPGGLAAQATALSAPYQVEGVETRTHHYEGETTFVVIALTRAPAVDEPDVGTGPTELEVLDFITVLGTAGWTVATLHDVEKRCRYPCTLDGGEECHWTALYALPGSADGIGSPVGAVEGHLDLTEYVSLEQPAAEPDPMADLRSGSEFVSLLWERDPAYRAGYRVDSWDPDSGNLELTIRQPAGDETTLQAGGCTSASREWLLTIDCNAMSLLASGGVPLLLSWPDYNSSKAEPLARFDYGGSRHHIVRFGSKAQDVVGLISGEPAGWRARFRLRDWAQLC